MEKPKVLIVEDNRIVAEDLKLKLQRMGYGVTEVTTSGEQAIKSIETHLPDLILMDIRLGEGMNGIETATKLRQLHRFPIVYLTAHADDDTIARAKLTEPSGYIIKPFDQKELQSTIEIALYKHRIDQKVRESEEWLMTTLRSIGDGVIATDIEGCIKFMNPLAESLTGWPEADAIGKKLDTVFQIINENTRQTVENPVTKVLETGQVVGLANHTVLISRDGREIPIKDSGAPIMLHDDEKTGVVLVFQDDTKSRTAERQIRQSLIEKEVLVKEIHHRVKNNMQVTLSLLQLQADSIADSTVHRVITEIRDRINAMAMIHDHLYQSEDLSQIRINDYLFDLVSIQFRSFGIDGDRISLKIDVAEIYLPVNFATPLALIVNELTSNSLKHAFPEGNNGTIHINISVEDNRYELLYRDTGIGIPAEIQFDTTDSFGLYLIRILVQHQLNGDISLNRYKGTQFRIGFELPVE